MHSTATSNITLPKGKDGVGEESSQCMNLNRGKPSISQAFLLEREKLP